MIGSVALLKESQPFPGWRALAPTLGCALVLANPGGAGRQRALSWRPMQGLGTISYPLYLWHWPLLSFAFIRYGEQTSLGFRLGLAGCGVLLALATYLGVERPAAAHFARRPGGTVAVLVAALATCWLLGKITRVQHGFPHRFPAAVAAIYEFPQHGYQTMLYRAGTCFDDRRFEALDAETVARNFAAAGCDSPVDGGKPTILILGDSHGAHLYPGVKAVFGDRANILQLNANYCAPLIERIDPGAGVSGTARCQILNDYIFSRVKALRPDVIVVGAYFKLFLDRPDWIYPHFLEEFRKGAARLHDLGGSAIVIAGQAPVWPLGAPTLAARELYEDGATPTYTRRGLDERIFDIDKQLRDQPWPPGVTYVSLTDALCAAQGCRRRFGDNLPDDLAATDYGHLSLTGSVHVARDILGPVIERALDRPGK
jgi:hypothetical protein